MDHLDKSISISIVTYNTDLNELDRCIGSLRLFKGKFNLTIIDNSKEPLIKEYATRLQNVTYRHLPANPGYGAAHNIALRDSIECGFKYHLVINSDVYFDSDILTPIISFLDKNPDVSLLMPEILNTDGTSQKLAKLLPTPFQLILRFCNISLPSFIGLRSNITIESRDQSKPLFAPFLSGCFMVIRNERVVENGLFDEDFFMYCEDLDLSRRLTRNGLTIYYPNHFAYHEHRRASRKSIRMLLIHLYSTVVYFNKWGWFIDNERVILNRKATSYNFDQY